jgi:hypothetical protein
VADPTASLASSGSSGTTAAVYLASRSVSRSCTFPHVHLATMPAAGAAAAEGDAVQHQQQSRAGGAPAPAPAPSAFAAPGVLGEKTFAVSPLLQAAVVDAAASLAHVRNSFELQTRQPGLAVGQADAPRVMACRRAALLC